MGEKKALSERFSKALEALIDAGCVKNKRAFAEACGITQQKLSEILNGRMNAGTDVLQGMLSNYPVRPEYLFSAKAPILQSAYHKPSGIETFAEAEKKYGKKKGGTEKMDTRTDYMELLLENSRLKDRVIELMEELARLKGEGK